MKSSMAAMGSRRHGAIPAAFRASARRFVFIRALVIRSSCLPTTTDRRRRSTATFVSLKKDAVAQKRYSRQTRAAYADKSLGEIDVEQLTFRQWHLAWQITPGLGKIGEALKRRGETLVRADTPAGARAAAVLANSTFIWRGDNIVPAFRAALTHPRFVEALRTSDPAPRITESILSPRCKPAN